MPLGINEASPNVCKQCGGNLVSYKEPIKFEIKGEPCDFYMYCGLIFISQRFYNVLCELNVTGFSVRKAKVIGWNRAKGAKDYNDLIYYELVVTGRCGFMMNLKSEILPKCSLCGWRLYSKETVSGVKFATEDYDGSDIFVFENQTNIPIVTEELKKKLTKAKISNLTFIELSKMEM